MKKLENTPTIYLDNAATTPLSEVALEEMIPFLTDNFANPSSVYQKSQFPKTAIESARRTVALAINAEPSEIFFTSGGTEANNWILTSLALKNFKSQKNHIITTSFEHLSILNTLTHLEKSLDIDVTYLPVNKDGGFSSKDFLNAIKKETFLVTIMAVNNEVGTLLPIKEIGDICRQEGIIFHCDGVAAIGNIPINVIEKNISSLSLSAHKFGGPKGVGALYIKNNVHVSPLIFGGAQERKHRAGTENVSGIVGMGSALNEAIALMSAKEKKLTKLGNRLSKGLLEIEESYIFGPEKNRVPWIINIGFKHIEGESALLMLDMEGIEASAGSACSSGALAYSHVLKAMGVESDIARGSIRFSLGHLNTEEEIDRTIATMTDIVKKLRKLSPKWTADFSK